MDITTLIPDYNERLMLAAEDIEAGTFYEYIAGIYEVDTAELVEVISNRLANQ